MSSNPPPDGSHRSVLIDDTQPKDHETQPIRALPAGNERPRPSWFRPVTLRNKLVASIMALIASPRALALRASVVLLE